MNRYIDADKTLDMMWNALYQYEDDVEKKNGLNLTERLDVQNGFEIAHKVVVDAPTEDVMPVVHAHWCVTDAYPHNVYCSRCLIKFAQTHWPVWEDNSLPRTYCPTCGAIMDEVVQ